jgi:uncharacterized protein (DUF885 family)
MADEIVVNGSESTTEQTPSDSPVPVDNTTQQQVNQSVEPTKQAEEKKTVPYSVFAERNRKHKEREEQLKRELEVNQKALEILARKTTDDPNNIFTDPEERKSNTLEEAKLKELAEKQASMLRHLQMRDFLDEHPEASDLKPVLEKYSKLPEYKDSDFYEIYEDIKAEGLVKGVEPTKTTPVQASTAPVASTKKIYSEAEINAMPSTEYAKNRADIELAYAEGRVR